MPPEPNDEGLLHHEHPSHPSNPYRPDEGPVVSEPSEAAIEQAAGESHHGLVRKEDGRRIGREEEALLALEHTQISRAGAWALTVLFLLTIFIPPLVQAYVEVRDQLQSRRETPFQAGAPGAPMPRFFDVYRELPSLEKIKNARNLEDARQLLPQAERLKSHEEALEDNSIWVQWMLPRVQYGLTKYGGAGNEQAYLGRERWLFYRPDVDYLTSPGFLDPAMVARRKRSSQDDAELTQPDPLRAILDFRDQLQTRGIRLVLMPMPVKPMLEAEHLSTSNLAGQPLQNPSYNAFLNELHKSRVLVYDPTERLRELKTKTQRPQFLQTDTHWTPEAMQEIARDISGYITAHTKMKPGLQPYTRRSQSLENLGDTAAMLSLAENQDLFSKQRVSVQRVFDANGVPWKRERSAEILMLGDSFCNVFSLGGMGWGENAGFAEQISYYLRRPLDSIVVNAGGSHTSRQRLIGEMTRAKKRGKDRLATVKVVIWEFSMRDLLIGDWKLLKLP